MKNLSNIIITLYTLYSEPDPDPGSLEKTDPLPKFTIMVKNSFLVNLRVLISNMTIIFSKFQSKDTQIRQFSSQIYFFQHETLLF